MPDIIAHTVPLYFFFKKKRFLIFILFGAILPDLLSRVPLILFGEFTKLHTLPAHSFFFLILASYFLCLFTKEYLRFGVFKALLIGSYSHVFFDLLQYNVKSYYLIFFPFSFKGYQFGLFWPEQSLYALPFILIVLVYQKITKGGGILNLHLTG